MEEKTFRKSVLTLMAGAAGSQVITFLLAPVVSRIYSPNDFSVFEQYVLLLSVLGVFSTFKMELAIPRAKNELDGRALVNWCFRRSIVVSCILLLVVLIFRNPYSEFLQSSSLSFLLLFLPLNILLFGFFQTLIYWHHRNRQFKETSKAKVVYNSTNEVSRISLGYLGFIPGGLIVGNVIARLVSVWLLFRKQVFSYKKEKAAEVKKVVHEFRNFKNYSTWSSFIGKMATWSHVLLFSHFYGLWSIGFFAFSRRLVLGPLGVFSQSFSQVFYQHISELSSFEAFKSAFLKFLIRLSLISAAIITVVFLVPNEFYSFILGEKWIELGDFLRLFICWFGLNFITGCLSFTNYRLNKQRQMLVLDILHLILIVAAIVFGYYSGADEWETLKLFVGAKITFYIINLICMIYFVLDSNEEKFNE